MHAKQLHVDGWELGVAHGGTGASTAGTALTNLGVTAAAQTLLDDATTAAIRNTLGFVSKYRTTTQSKTNNTLADDDTLSITGLDSSKGYEVWLVYIVKSADAAPDFQFEFVIDSGTLKAFKSWSELGPTDTTGVFGASAPQAVNIDATDSALAVCGTFTGATSIKTRWAQANTNATATIVQAGSYMKVTALT